MDKKKKSATKSFIWRIMGVIVLAAVTFAYTRNWVQTSWITVLHHGVFLIVFYFHERFWFRIAKNWESKWKYILKMITYETILGNLILGLITYLITGNVKQMTLITLTYIGIKHVMYFFNEIVWGRFKWWRESVVGIVLLILLSCSCGMNRIKAKSNIYNKDDYAASVMYFRKFNKKNMLGFGIGHKHTVESNKQSLLIEYSVDF